VKRFTGILSVMALLLSSVGLVVPPANAQERVKIAYSSADASNFVWYAAVDTGLYKKTGWMSSSFLFRAQPPPFRASLREISRLQITRVGPLRTPRLAAPVSL
jgi:hypothetical protein